MSGETITITATEFQRNIGKYQDAVASGQYEAVIVAAHGRPQMAIISAREYDALMDARFELARNRLALAR
jgi:prevent-host-death family protein